MMGWAVAAVAVVGVGVDADADGLHEVLCWKDDCPHLYSLLLLGSLLMSLFVAVIAVAAVAAAAALLALFQICSVQRRPQTGPNSHLQTSQTECFHTAL